MTTSRIRVIMGIVGLLAAVALGYVVLFDDGLRLDPERSDERIPLSPGESSPSKDPPTASNPKGLTPSNSDDGPAAFGLGSPIYHQQQSEPATLTQPSVSGRKAPYQPGPSKFRNATDPRARIVLARVGADLDAETYWLSAINDPATPAKERADLIEDLNEDGISDPARPTQKDLPLINSRIALIERLLPFAVDNVNAAAFREAHKDLVKMRDRLQE